MQKYLNLLVLFRLFFASSQLLSQNIDFTNRDVTAFNEYELSKNSIIIDTVEFGVLKNPLLDLFDIIQTKAFIYKRTNDDFQPQLHVWYHLEKNNSIRVIRYNWGLYNPSFSITKEFELLKDLVKNENLFLEKFSELQNEINSEFGTPAMEEVIVDNKHKIIKTVFWDVEHKIIELSMTFSRELKEDARGEIRADFGIEVTVTYK